MRRDYGIRSFSYGKFAASGTARHGLTDYLTLEGHVEGGERFALGGLGFDLGIGMFGVLGVAATQSRLAGASGRQYAFGYSYASQRFSVSLQRIQRTNGFRDLSVYDLPANVAYRLVRSSTQATGALNLGALGGTLGAGYFDVRGADGARTRIANLSYTRPLWRRATLYASVNKTVGEHGVAAQLQLIVPLGEPGVVTGALARDANNSFSERVQYSRSVPSDGGLGWNLAYAGGGSHYQQADATWRNRYFQAQGGVYGYGAGRGYARWGEVQGSVVVMDGAVLPANRVDDAFVLIDTQGAGACRCATRISSSARPTAAATCSCRGRRRITRASTRSIRSTCRATCACRSSSAASRCATTAVRSSRSRSAGSSARRSRSSTRRAGRSPSARACCTRRAAGPRSSAGRAKPISKACPRSTTCACGRPTAAPAARRSQPTSTRRR